MKKLICLLVLCFVFVGCETSVSTDTSMLPDKAENTTDLGNGWSKFDLEMDGVTRTFIYHRSSSASGYQGYESISELNPKELWEKQ